MAPETDYQPDTKNDAAKEEQHPEDRPEYQSGGNWWYQGTQLLRGLALLGFTQLSDAKILLHGLLASLV